MVKLKILSDVNSEAAGAWPAAGWGKGALECSVRLEEGLWAEGVRGPPWGLKPAPDPSSQDQDSLPVGWPC